MGGGEDPTPTITKIASEGSTGVVKTQPFSIEGTNLGYSTGDSVKINGMTVVKKTMLLGTE